MLANTTYRTAQKKYVVINEQNIFDQPVKNNVRTYDYIPKIVIGQGDDYFTCCILDYNYFNNYYDMIAIDLDNHQAFDTDPKTIKKNNFKGKSKPRSRFK